MAHENTEPRTETMELSGHVVTRGCRYLPDSKKWAPYVSIRPSWNPSAAMQIDVKPEEFQDTANDAMELARVLTEAWVKEKKPPLPT